MNILKKEHPLSVLILADHLIACGDELYSAIATELYTPQRVAEAVREYAAARDAYRNALKQPEPSNVHPSPKPRA